MLAGLLLVLLILADQLTKLWAVHSLKPIGSFPVIDGVFHLTYVENPGAAFGILSGKRWIFVLFTIAILLGMFYYYRSLPKQKPYSYLRALLLLVGAGAVGNFIDRLLHGYVVDFLHVALIDFPVFNLADCYISVGAGAICFLLLFVIKEPTGSAPELNPDLPEPSAEQTDSLPPADRT